MAADPVLGSAGPASLPVKIGKILVPVDFLTEGKPALRYAAHLASITGAKVILLNVEECPQFGADYGFLPVDLKKMRRELSLKAAALQHGALRGVPSEFLPREGIAFEEIIRAARETKSDLIVMTTHGYTGLRHMLMGSTAERTVRYSPCPVLILRSISRRKKRTGLGRVKGAA